MALTLEIAGGVAVATVDHPPSNLLDGAFFVAVLDLLGQLEEDPDVRVVIFRSADPDFFVMHGDVNLVRDVEVPAPEPGQPNIAAATFARLHTGRLVTIGLLDGIARGGGCEVLSAMDMRFGSERALVGQPEIVFGIIPGAGGAARWPEIAGRGRALDVLLSARDVAADELYAMGWLDRLVPSQELEATGLAVARRIALMPPDAVAATKRVVDAPRDRAPAVESAEVAHLLATGIHRDRMTRFLEAGGQTREQEIARMQSILDVVLER
jgi:enoyl-CoA hydratase/carnithine racemase